MLKQLRYFFTLLLLAVASVGWAADETITFSEQGYDNGQAIESIEGEAFSITFDKGSNSNAPKYYNTGSAIRCYGGNSFTVSSENTITKIELTFSSGEGTNAITTDVDSYENGTWTGAASSVTFTIGGTSGHRRIASISVTYAGDQPTKQNATVKIEPTTINIGGTAKVTTNGPELMLESSNESIATVSGNIVTGVAVGEVTITATWEENDEFNAGSKDFTITVVDPNAPGSENNPYTVAEALAVIDGLADGAKTPTTVYIKGIISEIVEVSTFNESTNSGYGNATYWLSDDGTTNGVQAFRGFYLDNAKFTATDQIQVGDEVVVVGELQRYVKNGTMTPEVAQGNYIVSIVNSGKPSAELSFDPTELTVEIGDDFTEPTLNNPYNVAVTYTSSDENVAEVDADGSLTINGAGTAIITATFAGDDNYAAGDASYTLTVVDPDAPGASIDNPYTVEEAIAFIETLGTSTSGDVYVKGIISQIDEVSVDHGNATYWISDDGETTVQMEVYRGKYLDGANFEDEGQIAVGDEVIVFGKLKDYNGTPEFSQGNYIVDLVHNDVPVLADAELSYPVEAFTATLGEENEFPVLANPNELAVTYTSSNEEVATIDAEGNITLVAAGETTITATSEATDAFKAGEASYVLTVEEQQVPGVGIQYQLVTSTDEITSGKYLIVAYTKDGNSVAFDGSREEFDKVSNTQDVTIENNVITTDKDIYFNIDVENGTLQSASGYYIGQTANSNGLKQSEEADAYTNTFAIGEDGSAVISIAIGENTVTLRYNYASDQLRFRYYKSGQQPVYLYKAVEEVEEEVITVTIGSAEYATLYYSDKAFEIPEGVTAKIVTDVDNKQIVFEDLDEFIPKGAAVVLNGPQGTYDFKVAYVNLAAPENNLLKGSDEAAMTEGGDKYYKLTVKNDEVGFYYGAEEGAAFENGAHKAYLALPAGASNAKFFIIGKDGSVVSDGAGLVDGINEITAEGAQEYYNLNGVRVNTLRKGIYIVGGKKVIIK